MDINISRQIARRISAATTIAKIGYATLSSSNAKATAIRFGGSGGVSEVGSEDYVASATAEFEIWRGPLAVSPHANGACSSSEGVRQTFTSNTGVA